MTRHEIEANGIKGKCGMTGAEQREEPPETWFVCDVCDGSGEEVFGEWGHEPGCGHGHTMDDARPCGRCGGDGGWIGPVEADLG